VILIECDPDEFMVRSIGFLKVKHVNGKGNVMNMVGKIPGVIGIIDDDPGNSQPSERLKYIEKESKSTIKLLVKNNDESKKIIVLSPDLEGWILSRAKQNRVSPKKFGLPDDGHGLHSIYHIEKKKNFRDFIEELIGKEDEEIEKLKTWLRGY